MRTSHFNFHSSKDWPWIRSIHHILQSCCQGRKRAHPHSVLFLISSKRPSVTVIAPIYTRCPPFSHPSPLCWAVNHSPPLNGGRLLPVESIYTCRTHAINSLISHPWRQKFTFVMAGLIFLLFTTNIFNVFIQWSVFHRLSVVVNAVSLTFLHWEETFEWTPQRFRGHNQCLHDITHNYRQNDPLCKTFPLKY